MYSLEQLKELAIKQVRAAANLIEMCENAEKGLTVDNDKYNKVYLRSQRNYRLDLLAAYGLTMTEEEKELWDNVMEELD